MSESKILIPNISIAFGTAHARKHRFKSKLTAITMPAGTPQQLCAVLKDFHFSRIGALWSAHGSLNRNLFVSTMKGDGMDVIHRVVFLKKWLRPESQGEPIFAPIQFISTITVKTAQLNVTTPPSKFADYAS